MAVGIAVEHSFGPEPALPPNDPPDPAEPEPALPPKPESGDPPELLVPAVDDPLSPPDAPIPVAPDPPNPPAAGVLFPSWLLLLQEVGASASVVPKTAMVSKVKDRDRYLDIAKS